MEYDADTLRDMQTILSYVENLIESQFREIPEERKEKVLDILERPDRYYVEGDTLLIHASNPILEKFPGDIKEDIPFDMIRKVDLIGDSSLGFYNAVYLEKNARFLFPNAMEYQSSSSHYHLDAFKKGLEERMKEEEESFESLMLGFSFNGDLYTVEYIGDTGLDVYCAAHPFANTSFVPLSFALATIDSPMIESRYIKRLTIREDGIPSLSSFRQSFFDTGVECLLDECQNLEEISVSDDCLLKEAILNLAKKRGIKVVD